MTVSSDEQIVEQARAGDGDAFGELVRRWERPIFSLSYGMLGSAEEARDATQETFFAAFRNLRSFRGEAKVSSWLHRIAVNQCITRRRRSSSRPEAPLLADDGGTCDVQAFHSARPSPLGESERRERSEAVRRAVQALPADLRAVVVMKEFEELTFQEIAETLGVPLSTVKSRLYTALAQLRRRLEQHGAEAPGR